METFEGCSLQIADDLVRAVERSYQVILKSILPWLFKWWGALSIKDALSLTKACALSFYELQREALQVVGSVTSLLHSKRMSGNISYCTVASVVSSLKIV